MTRKHDNVDDFCRRNRGIRFGAYVSTACARSLAVALVVGVSAALALGMLSSVFAPYAALVVGFGAFIAVTCRYWEASHLILFAVLWSTMAAAFAEFRSMPLSIVAPVGLYGLAVVTVAPLRRTAPWLMLGSISAVTVIWSVVITLASGIALYIWSRTFGPDFSGLRSWLSSMPLWQIAVAGVVFASVNAAAEELVFRGVVQSVARNAGMTRTASNLLQAACFACLHYAGGFPGGVTGMALTFVYGIVLGWLRDRSGGMFAPWLTHAATDITIFILILFP